MRADRIAIAALLLALGMSAGAQPQEYRIGPQDVLTITVWNQPTLSGPFTVESDGTFTYPLLGTVRAAGLTVRDIEADLTTRLGAGYVKAPQIRVTVDQHRSQRVLVLGEVRTPGSYPLTRPMTLVEALALAGSTTPRAGDEVLVIHAAADQLVGTGEGEQEARSEITHIPLDAVAGVSLGRELLLADGDVVFVPVAPTVHVFGQVRSPGEYPLRRHARVLQVLALAGGLTDRASRRDIRIVRSTSTGTVEVKAQLNDAVEPGDVIMVGERFF
jgi:polysaccharide export outer membrane protein